MLYLSITCCLLPKGAKSSPERWVWWWRTRTRILRFLLYSTSGKGRPRTSYVQTLRWFHKHWLRRRNRGHPHKSFGIAASKDRRFHGCISTPTIDYSRGGWKSRKRWPSPRWTDIRVVNWRSRCFRFEGRSLQSLHASCIPRCQGLPSSSKRWSSFSLNPCQLKILAKIGQEGASFRVDDSFATVS